jgi:hypothetical protein
LPTEPGSSQRDAVGLALMLEGVVLLHLVYLIAIFGFGVDCDLLSCETSYPSYMLRLPLSTPSLVAWPLLFGAVSILLFWVGIWWMVVVPLQRWIYLRPFGLPGGITPIWCIATLACIQAAMWSTFRGPFGRAISVLSAVGLPCWATLWAYHSAGAAETTIAIGLLFVTAAAYGLAIHNLGQARRGASPGWPISAWPLSGRIAKSRSADVARRVPVFRSPMRALVWYEWRRYFLPLVLWTVANIGLWCALAPAAGSDSRALALIFFANIFGAPIVMFGIGGLGIGGLNHRLGDRHVSPFLTSRPVTSIQFVGAKWLAAAIAAIVACMVSIAAYPLSIFLAGNETGWFELWNLAIENYSPGKVWLGGSVLLVLYPIVTWVFLVQTLPAKLAGRPWLETAIVWSIALLVGIILLSEIVANNNSFRMAFIEWSVSLLLAAKTLAAAVTLRELVRTRLIAASAVFVFLLCWLLIIATSIALVHMFWLTHNTRHFLLTAGVIVLFWPITRLALAPLALHWKRHS